VAARTTERYGGPAVHLRADLHRFFERAAARRGEKGFSSVVAEAIGFYLRREPARETCRKRARGLRASITPEEADQLRLATERLRASWR
jgi:hypothetical protein